jgi:K+-transporting ATPase ATPase C chain
MKRHLLTAFLMTAVTTVLLGIVYPLVVTAFAQLAFRDKANGQLLSRDGKIIGSRIIGQPFSGPRYFHSRPSAAGDGYDATNSSGSNLAATNQKLVQRVQDSVQTLRRENGRDPIPVDLVTTSGSGLDPEISIAAADFQVPRIASERHIDADTLQTLIRDHTRRRQLGVIGEPGVNVLELNLALNQLRDKPRGTE